MSAEHKASGLQSHLFETKQLSAKNAGYFELFSETDYKKPGPGTACFPSPVSWF